MGKWTCEHVITRGRRGGYAPGFTLVELLLATVIGALVVAVAAGTLRSVARARERADYYSEMLAHGRYALNQIRNDLANFYRCGDRNQMCLEGRSGGSANYPADRLRAYVVSDRAVGERLGESDVYEVEYMLREQAGRAERYLARRVAPVLNAQVGNEKGILSEVSRYVRVLEFEYFDGQTWQRRWGRSMDYPELVRVTMVVVGPEEEDRPISLSQEISLEPLPDRALLWLGSAALEDTQAGGQMGEQGGE